MEDFIFGDLTSNATRTDRVIKEISGVSHLNKREPLAPKPQEAVKLSLSIGPDHPFDKAWVYYTTDGSDPVGKLGNAENGSSIAMDLVETRWETILWDYVRHFSAAIPPQPNNTIVRYRLSGSDGIHEVFADGGAYYAWFVHDQKTPEWSKQAIIYQIFTDRFYSPDPSFPTIEPKPSLKCDGTLKGITSKLDYLSDLGVNAIWLTPFFDSPSYHHYNAKSLYDIDPQLGTMDDFKDMIAEAKKRGIKFIMDLVPNHWSSKHPTFIDATTNPDSEYRNWYTFDNWPNEYRSFFTVKELPQVNLRDAKARKHVIDAAVHWQKLGVSAFRVDYCIGPTPDFYAELRKATQAVDPDCWIFGEAIDTPIVQRDFYGVMDGALDFMLLNSFRQTFATGQWDLIRFNDFLERQNSFFPKEFTRPSFLDNHDMNRFLWMAKGDKQKLLNAAVCQFTLPNAPIIYYGTEVGLSQQRDMIQNGHAIHEEGRLPMLWDDGQDKKLLKSYKKLIQLRKNFPFITDGRRETLVVSKNKWVYQISGDQERLTVIINLGDKAVTQKLILDNPEIVMDTGSARIIDGDNIPSILISPATACVLVDKV